MSRSPLRKMSASDENAADGDTVSALKVTQSKQSGSCPDISCCAFRFRCDCVHVHPVVWHLQLSLERSRADVVRLKNKMKDIYHMQEVGPAEPPCSVWYQWFDFRAASMVVTLVRLRSIFWRLRRRQIATGCVVGTSIA